MASPLLHFSKLKDELLVHPIMTSLGSLALSTFISYSVYGVIDWRPVTICVASDIVTIGLDHYNDQASSLECAKQTANNNVLNLFSRAKMLLIVSAVLLLAALSLCPPATWAITACFVTPALLWDTTLFYWRTPVRRNREKKNDDAKRGFVIKRIPGMKAIFIGIIRGCGTYAVVRSILSNSTSIGGTGSSGPWSPHEIVIWSTINRACHAVMADVRDFDEDWKLQVPTIPVLMKSVFRTQALLTTIHLTTMFYFISNVYIVFASVYSIALVWALNEKSRRGLYRFSFHSQTITAILYGSVEAYKNLHWAM
ncbi:hypothetical protein CPB84DRAFT_1685923 [Gymnopilus junonius]|uniref:Uncharacterized protein n=1 Tax=Gymnopilus junonius TaxID=109634 RepID=A0A9P5NGR1_GYMJU|nr:hypothetical protein CPB84DRAFT_1685923 [Gymnopilus junonius]